MIFTNLWYHIIMDFHVYPPQTREYYNWGFRHAEFKVYFVTPLGPEWCTTGHIGIWVTFPHWSNSTPRRRQGYKPARLHHAEFRRVWPGCFRIPSSEWRGDQCKLGVEYNYTAWVVLLAEEESQLQVTRSTSPWMTDLLNHVRHWSWCTRTESPPVRMFPCMSIVHNDINQSINQFYSGNTKYMIHNTHIALYINIYIIT